MTFRIFGIGTTGLVGSRIAQLLEGSYSISHHSSQTGFDITNPMSLLILHNDTTHNTVLHMAAKTDVDGCEKDKDLGEEGLAWKINVLGTQHIVDACKTTNKKLIYISTDFVFDGESTPVDGYTEDDTPSPINWYGVTKYEGERIVMESGLQFLILRIAYPFRKADSGKKDFVHAISDRLKVGEKIRAVTNHIMTPTFVDDIAIALKKLLDTGASGIYHVVGTEYITPFDVAVQIAMTFQFDLSLVEPVTREDFFRDRAPRPFNLSIENAKIERLGVKMRTFTEGLEEILNSKS